MNRSGLNKALTSTKLNATPFRPSIADVKRWTDVLNFIMFEGKSLKWGRIQVRPMRDFAWSVPYFDGRNKRRCELHIRNRFKSFSMFYSVLCHELLHLAEYHELGTINHGDFFYSHREMLAKIGIKLQARYEDIQPNRKKIAAKVKKKAKHKA